MHGDHANNRRRFMRLAAPRVPYQYMSPSFVTGLPHLCTRLPGPVNSVPNAISRPSVVTQPAKLCFVKSICFKCTNRFIGAIGEALVLDVIARPRLVDFVELAQILAVGG